MGKAENPRMSHEQSLNKLQQVFTDISKPRNIQVFYTKNKNEIMT